LTPTPRAFLQSELRLGRAVGESGLWFPSDNRVSRDHATLRFDAGERRAWLTDASKTGTFVCGQRHEHGELAEGQLVRVGDSYFLFRFEEESSVGDRKGDAESPLKGVSTVMHRMRQSLALVGRSSATVLVMGETGTGKELVARGLHEASRRSGPLVAVNCAAIPESLAESLLFGHVAGAFSGAKADSPGFFRSARQGTLLLDEVGELPATLQATMLRALEERSVTPL
jgi:transcriptional regulator with AAA-type ATPase domain